MKTILFLFVLLFSSGLKAQPMNYPCTADTSLSFSIVYEIWSYKNNEGVIWVEHILKMGDIKDEKCILPPVAYDKKKKNYYFQGKDSLGETRLYINNDKVKTIMIQVHGTTGLDLSKLDFLKTIDFTGIKSLKIAGDNNVNLELKLKKWPNYDRLKKSVTDLLIEIEYIDLNSAEHIQEFKQLETLYFNGIMNLELRSFKNLKNLVTFDPCYFFSNEAAKLEKTSYHYFVDGNFHLRSMHYGNINEQYAQRAFFFQYMNPSLSDHPVFMIDSMMNILDPGKMKGSKTVAFLESEIYPNLRFANDTIAFGQIENGMKTGIWKYKICNFWKGNSFFGNQERTCPFFYYDHSRKDSLYFPVNGAWTYRFSNGMLAIEGTFKNGKKEGTWKFYDPNGKLSSLKTFRKDLPSGLFIDYGGDRELGKRFYFDKENYITYIENGAHPVYLTVNNSRIADGYCTGNSALGYNPYTSSNGLLLIRDGKVLWEVLPGSQKYDRLIWKHFRQYLD